MLTWPLAVLPFKSARWDILTSATLGQANLAGIFQAATYDGGGLWGLSLAGLIMTCPDAHRAFRALQASMDGGATPIEINVPDWYVAPTFADYNVPELVTWADGATFGDGSHWSSGQIMAHLVEAAELHATSLIVNVGAAELRGGERFSVRYGETKRMHQIRTVTQNGDDWAITVRPPLRADTGALKELDFNNPGCAMVAHVTDASTDPLGAMVDLGRWVDPSPVFIEYFAQTDGSS